MKKYKIIGWLLLTVGMLLMACSGEDNEAIPNEKPTSSEEQQKEPVNAVNKEELAKAQKQIAEAFPNRLTELAKTYGFLFDEIDFYQADFELGIAYAKLVDFNHDGVGELITLHKGGAFFESPYPYRNTDDYVLEIFGTDYSAAKEIHVQTIAVENNNDISLGFVELKDGTKVYYERTIQPELGEETETTIYYVMEEAGSFTKKVFTATKSKYTIDDKDVEKAAFENELEKFAGKDNPIIQSEKGKSAFAFQEKSSGQMVGDIFAHFSKHSDEIAAVGEQVEASTLQDAVEKILNLPTLDVNNLKEMEARLSYIIFYEGFDVDRPSFDIYAGVSEEQIAKKYEQLYGEPLDLKNVELARPSMEEYSVIAYEDGVFYILPTDYYGSTVIRNIKQATKLPNDLYYVEVQDIEFDDYVYTLLVGYDETKMEQYMDRPYEEWSKEMRDYTRSKIPRYIVLKEIDGAFAYRYIGYKPLSLEEIQAYE